jgi:hypothetical protein
MPMVLSKNGLRKYIEEWKRLEKAQYYIAYRPQGRGDR